MTRAIIRTVYQPGKGWAVVCSACGQLAVLSYADSADAAREHRRAHGWFRGRR